MPTVTLHEEFKADPAYDEEKHLAKDLEQARVFFDKELACVDGIGDPTLQLICMFAMIDRMAQEWANYPKDSKNAFCQFVLKHQKKCDYLECVDPVTLYYHVEDLIDETVFIPGFPPEKEVSIENLGYLYKDPIKKVLSKEKAQEILDYIEKKQGKDFAERKAKEHQLISLLYRMRSKAVHEMSGLGENLSLHRETDPTEPYYRDTGRLYVKDDHLASDDVVELVIPNLFVRNILADCIDGYLEDCGKNKRFPFSNNDLTRKHNLSWYDK